MKILSAILIFLLLSSPVYGITVSEIPIEELPKKADFVIIGTVTDSEPNTTPPRLHSTDYTIQIEEKILGNIPSIITTNFTLTADNYIKLEVGRKYLIFCYYEEKDSIYPVGCFYGIFRVIFDEVKQQEFIVGYHWRRLEKTEDGEIIGGALTELDSTGALTLVPMLTDIKRPKNIPKLPKPIVRDAEGNIIPQDESVFKKPKKPKRGKPITKSEFIDFIKSQVEK